MTMVDHDLDRDPPPADVFAGEYVLGVLDARQRRDARLRIARDPAFARMVDDWTQRLAALHGETGEATVPAHLWPRIRTRLGWSPVQGAKPAGNGFWKGAAAAGFAAAAALAVVAVQKPRVIVQPAADVAKIEQTAPGPATIPVRDMPVTQLQVEGGKVAYLATVDTNTGRMLLVPVPGTVPEGVMAPVLWLIPPGGTPKSLGYVGKSHSHWVDVPKAELESGMKSGWTVAITMEPKLEEAPQAPSSAPMAVGKLSL